MKQANPCVLTINGGSSSIKFALFETADSLRRILAGSIERIGLPDARFAVKGLNNADNFSLLDSCVEPRNGSWCADGLDRGTNPAWRVDGGGASRGTWRTKI